MDGGRTPDQARCWYVVEDTRGRERKRGICAAQARRIYIYIYIELYIDIYIYIKGRCGKKGATWRGRRRRCVIGELDFESGIIGRKPGGSGLSIFGVISLLLLLPRRSI
jgi:hypothetical protein